MSGHGSYYDAVQYPWLQTFKDNYSALIGVRSRVPSNMKSAYDAAVKTGSTINTEIKNGTTIDADIVNNWFYSVKMLADRMNDKALSTQFDDNAVNSDPFVSFEYAAHQIQTALPSVPWELIIGGIAAVIIIPLLLNGRK